MNQMVKSVTDTISKNSPVILSSMAAGGVVATAILAAKCHHKARKHVESLGEEELPIKETLKETWRFYIPPVLMGCASIACIIGSNKIQAKRNAAVASAYLLTDAAFRDFKANVSERLTQNQLEKVETKISQDKIDKDPVESKEVIITDDGDVLCYDETSGRYFKSSMEKIRRTENTLNKDLLQEGWVSLNDAYFCLGLPTTTIGDDLGWDLYSNDGLIDFNLSTCLVNDKPCISLRFYVQPKWVDRSGGRNPYVG